MPNRNPIKEPTTDTFKYSIDQVNDFLKVCGQRTEKNIRALLDEHRQNNDNRILIDAIDYSTFGDGKKIRPGLVYACADLLSLNRSTVDPIACAVELIHCYSLIHDDLPSMDNDDMRRGKPSCHRRFGEAVAILAGDAMQALAFECLSKAVLIDTESRNNICCMLAQTAGISGMAGGQTMDILSTTKDTSDIDIKKIHSLKTGALIKSCILMVIACVSNIDSRMEENLRSYADKIGLCFQIRDDLIDASVSHSLDQEKISYVTIYGRDNTLQQLNDISRECLNHLSLLGEQASMLINITQHMVKRQS